MTSASLPIEKKRIVPWEGWTLAILFGLGIILWPFLSFGAIFMFDSPIQSRSDWVNRTTIAYFIWLYPATYAVTCLAYYFLRRFGVGRLLSCFAWGLPVAIYFIFPALVTGRGMEDANPKRVQLLYRTDHVALLAGCREVMANRNTYKQRKEDFRSFIDPKDPKLPGVIGALQPLAIISDDENSLYLQLHGGSDRCGVLAFSEKAVTGHTNAWTGEIMLTTRLFFFDEGLTYQDDHAVYLNKLKALKPDDAPAPKW